MRTILNILFGGVVVLLPILAFLNFVPWTDVDGKMGVLGGEIVFGVLLLFINFGCDWRNHSNRKNTEPSQQ